MNTHAKIILICLDNIDLSEILNTRLFNFERAEQAHGWLKEIRGEHVPETEEYSISSFNYLARKPFNLEKLCNLLHNTKKFGKLIRSKGYFWLATRPQFSGKWSQAVGVAHYSFADMFWTFIPKAHWPTDKYPLEEINKQRVEPFGDTYQELVLIVQKLDKARMILAS